MDTQAIGLRAARAALFTALCITLSAGAHVLLSSMPLPLSALTLTGGAVFTLAFTLAGTHERGYRPIAALLVPLELAADTVFTSGQHTCYGAAGGPIAGPLRSMGVDLICGGGALGTPLARAAASTDGSALMAGDALAPWLLLAAHIMVGLAAAAWLWRGEVALARVLRAVATLTFRPLLIAYAAVTVRRETVCTPPRPADFTPTVGSRILAHSVGRRGPPCWVS
ncbi:hypothetical protein [Streptomyces murinus]|uniref:hypothetical protein n=1 Tax=Streptomyces murinus TaxID=33900 RepID=UPI002114CC67|nr:hypothetical protein [Streptomyces murinus]